jgi:hypothetical protein
MILGMRSDLYFDFSLIRYLQKYLETVKEEI